MLTADAEQSVNCSLVHWGGDVVYTAQQKQQQRQLQQRQRRYNRGAGGATSGDGDALDDGAYSDEVHDAGVKKNKTVDLCCDNSWELTGYFEEFDAETLHVECN